MCRYCSLKKINGFKLTCNIDSLNKLGEYTDRNDTVIIKIYRCKACNGLWKEVLYNQIVCWLKVGEVTRKEYTDFDSNTYYPIIWFENEEAYYYDSDLFCGPPSETSKYCDLTCSPKTLVLIKEVSSKESIVHNEKIEIFRCKKCGIYWKIYEEYDTHHGKFFLCIKLGEEVKLPSNDILKFEYHEIEDSNI